MQKTDNIKLYKNFDGLGLETYSVVLENGIGFYELDTFIIDNEYGDVKKRLHNSLEQYLSFNFSSSYDTYMEFISNHDLVNLAGAINFDLAPSIEYNIHKLDKDLKYRIEFRNNETDRVTNIYFLYYSPSFIKLINNISSDDLCSLLNYVPLSTLFEGVILGEIQQKIIKNIMIKEMKYENSNR